VIKLQELMTEFKEDLKKQCIVLMGLPASGKSTFIDNDIKKYISGFTGYKVTNSDDQVKAAQYQYAKSHFEWLAKHIKSKKDITKFVFDSQYKDNTGKMRDIPLTFNWWNKNKDKGIKTFYKTFYKSYYATYFDIRDIAQSKERQLFKTKIVTSGNMLIIDTVAAKSNKILDRLTTTREQDFNNTIIYLEIDVNMAIQRDNWRKENRGRGVGEPIIVAYATQMNSAFNAYKTEGKKDDGVVDRLLHFKWKPQGASPIKGSWNLISDDKFFIKRKLKGKK